jgi:ribokinase
MRILVVGNSTLDTAFYVPHLPRAGETVIADLRNVDGGGKGANQAVAAARAGADAWLTAVIGRDADGALLRSRLAAEGLNLTYLVERDTVQTDQSVIFIDAAGENVIASTCAAAESLTSGDADRALGTLERGDLLLMQGNLSHETTQHALRRAKDHGAVTLVNAAPIRFAYGNLWPLIDFAIMNAFELERLSHHSAIAEGCTALVERGAGCVIATRGPDGVLVASPSAQEQIPGQAVKAVDTTGAGDVFCGVFAAGIARQMAVTDSARWAARAAALSVTRRGTQRAIPAREEMRSLC